MEHQEQEEEIEIRPEEYQGDTEPIVNTYESEFIKDVEELAEYARETKGEDDSVELQVEQENAAYYAEQYYEKIKEKEVLNEHNNKEEQETEELMQEVAEEFKDDQESGYKSDEIEKEDISNASKEITSTEEFEYLWEVRDKLDQEGKTSEEIEEVMHEAEEMYETLKNAEKLYEELQEEKLKQVDHEDEATEEDLKEDLDRVDLIEQAVELEEELVQQGKSQEEIDTRVEEVIEEVIETAEFEEKLEKIIEKERKELKNREEEESVEKEDLDRVDLIEQAVELEEKLVQRGKSQEEIDMSVEEAIEEVIETTEFEEKLEKIIEKERKELKDREDEEDIDNTREDIDRPAEAEYYMEVEEELHRQGISQEEIDEQMEEIAGNYQNEINKKQEKEEEPNVSEKLEKHDLDIDEQNSSAEQCHQIELTSALSNEKEVETCENVENKENLETLKPELGAIESESEDKRDFLEEITKLGSEESDEEENENLQELYRQETGRRSIYARKKTKGYSQWLEQRELGSEKIKNSKSESEKKKEIDEEDWKATLNQWIKEASEEVCNAEFISELKKALESYNEFEYLTRKFMELYEKGQNEKLSEKEKNRLKFLTGRLQELDPIQLELLTSVFFIKKYITEQYWYDFWNKPLVNRVLSKFFKHISQKILKLKELINPNEKLKLKKCQLIENQECDPSLDLVKQQNSLKNEVKELTEKFTKSDIEGLIQTNNNNQESFNKNIEIPEFLKIKYHYLLNPKLVTAFIQYIKHFKNLGEDKSPNFGTRYITKDFKNWLDNKENSQELQKICNSIIKRNEIINFIIDLIQTTNLNQTQLVEVLTNLGLSLNPETVKNVALKYIYQGNTKLYSKRFPRGLHRRESILISKDVSKDYHIPGVKDTQIFIYDNKFRLSINFVKTLSKITYSLLLKSGLKDKQDIFMENVDIEKRVKNYIKINNILDRSPINSPGFKQFLDKTIKDFTVIISSLMIYNEKSKGELLKLKNFAQELIKRNYNLESALVTLRTKILPEILNHLNHIFTDFNLKTLSKRILEQDEIGKVCGYCGIKKPWSEFQKISKGGHLSKCKKCMSIYGEIIKYKKKLRLLFEMQNGRFKGKCSTSNCSTDFLHLPAFDFHHPSEKNYSWIKLLKKKYQTLKDLLEEDGVFPLCKNCHAPKQQSILLDYKNLILSQYLFRNKSGKQKNTKEISNMIDEAILNYPNLKDKLEKDSQYIGHVKYMIKSWIRKRAIVEQLYGGKCINCGETNLSSLTFHHMNPEKKKDISSEAFRKFSIKQLANKMIQEECICLCANCHTMSEATIFREHSEEIFVDMEKKEIYVKRINYFYEKLTKNIQKEHKRIIKASQKFPVIDYLEERFG